MNYKYKEKDKEVYFRYLPKKIKDKEKQNKTKNYDNPFQVLANNNAGADGRNGGVINIDSTWFQQLRNPCAQSTT